MELPHLDEVLRNETRAYAFPWTEGIFRSCVSGGGHECWVAQLRGKIAGHAVFTIAAEESHLLNLCVGRDYQSHGCGRAFMHFIVQRAAHAAQVMFLEVRRSNWVAANLYESMGFVEVGIRKDYYPAPLGREDARVMALQLLPAPPQETVRP